MNKKQKAELVLEKQIAKKTIEAWDEFRKSLRDWMNDPNDHDTPDQFFEKQKSKYLLIKK